MTLGADPLDYISAQFSGQEKSDSPPPKMLLSERAAEVWRCYVADSRLIEKAIRNLENEHISMRGTVLSFTMGAQWPYLRALRFALGNSWQVSATRLTRYCLAVNTGQHDFADFYHEPALLQYVVRQKESEAAYGTLIPEALRLEAAEFRRSLGLPALSSQPPSCAPGLSPPSQPSQDEG
jgi:hypothetical protein